MSATAFEMLLARIYVDEEARTKFLADPCGEAVKAGLTEQECVALEKIDRVGLELAANSFAKKRAQHSYSHKRASVCILRWFRSIVDGFG